MSLTSRSVSWPACEPPFILAAHSLPGNPYDGYTLAWSLAHTRLNTGVPIKTAAVDKGCRGPRAAWPSIYVVIPGQRSTARCPA